MRLSLKTQYFTSLFSALLNTQLNKNLSPFLKVITCLLCFLCYLNAGGQQYNNWFFGDGASIRFNVDSLPDPYAVTTTTPFTTSESSCAISDTNGDLLFYTDGVCVYSKNHTIMQNGTALMGNQSSFQGALIIPLPDHDSLFYIFTTDAFENSFQNGYRYSIVNMNRDNGLGEVIVKNVLLFSQSTERLTAARHSNGIDVWILGNELNSNAFYAWLLTCNGLQTNPVISVTGEIMNQNLMNVGELKISSDGEQVCQTHFPIDGDVAGTANFFQLFDFNNTTGQLSNPKKIILPNTNTYTCEYSADSRFLYLAHSFSNKIEQVETKLATPGAIAASRISIPASPGIFRMQMGPDGKIYVNLSTVYLSAINFPNKKGIASNFHLNKIFLNKSAKLGLPFILNELTSDANSFSYQTIDSCSGTVKFTGPVTLAAPSQWLWNFGDGITSTDANPIHTFVPAGSTYGVTLSITSPLWCGKIIKSQHIVPGGISAKANFTFSANCDSMKVRFMNSSFSSDNLEFEWSFGDGATSVLEHPVHTYANRRSYRVLLRIKAPGSVCILDSVSKIIEIGEFNIQASADQTITEGQSVQLNVTVTGGGISFQWSPDTWLSSSTIANPVAIPADDITYIVTAENTSGCIAADSVSVKVISINEIYVPTAFTPNNDGLNEIFKPVLGTKFSLQNFSVFTRWGEKLFSTSQKDIGWDGKIMGGAQPTGVYTWLIKAVNKEGQSIIKKGTVVLIR